MKSGPNAERALFLSLWSLVILTAALWWLWPSSKEPRAIASHAKLQIAPELLPWFSSGEIKAEDPNRYSVTLQLTAEYRKSLKGKQKTVHLGYHLIDKDQTVLQGLSPCYVTPEKPESTVILSNPKRILAKKIVLFMHQ